MSPADLIDKRLIIDFCDKNVAIARFCEKNDVFYFYDKMSWNVMIYQDMSSHVMGGGQVFNW